MASSHFVVQAYHYAQFTVTRDNDEGFEVEILDENDVELAIVAVRPTLRQAEMAARVWREANDPDDEDTRGALNMPLASVNVYEVGPSVGEGKFVKTVEI